MIQKNYGGGYGKVWVDFGDIYYDIDTVKSIIKNHEGEFRIFKRTVTNWEKVKQ